MSSHEKYLQSMMFNYETTGKTDFRATSIEPVVRTDYKPKARCVRIRPPPLKNLSALTEWKDPCVPFYLLHTPKDVVQTNPWSVQKPFSKPPDLMKEEVIKTRPRFIISPALSLDDMADVRTRRILVECTYTSDARAASRPIAELFAAVSDSTRAPLPLRPAPANSITLARLKPPLVPAEWRMDTLQWDNKQLRTHCDPTQRFWLKLERPKNDNKSQAIARRR